MSQKFSTTSLHAGHDFKANAGTRAVPLYQSTSYVFNNSDHAANLFSLAEPGFIYTRINNPTVDVLEQRLAALEGGIAAVATASGTSAISTTLLTLLRAGDHIIASNSLYGGTYNLLSVTLPRLGITTTFVDPNEPDSFINALQENTRAVFVESLGNPKLDVLDLKKISSQAKQAKVPLIVDNTVATPFLLNPIEHGANIVIHSLTKYINGNGTALGGIIIDAGTFDWTNGKFPEFTEPSPGYHGLVYSEALEAAAFIAKVRIEGLRDLGAAISPFNAWQIIQGLETLELRIQKHSENALKIANWLESREEVAWVNYPGLSSSKYYQLAQEYLPKGQSGIVTFGVKSGFEGAKTIADKTELFSLLANIGDTKSLIIHPASTTHQQLSDEQQLSTGVSKDLIRLSVGLESVDDLIADLESAFEKVSQTVKI
ncbi:MAG: O-acetylhomoserine aminocarboxypropyltransferase/cysteine synthase family protein [Bacteroidota bacterium]|uniref:O-acetylhomoserine aminocarboxypropyltransferase/cysteine synthase family protein n=1 Tax=Nonlabens tegetincola TaxID=323273 RepID=UPI000A203899|nr:O-acetylhomoserine aminocarboxypropyltransferase/cysteine synthase family protein [Nonlabens tegetincola]ARN70242.1 O-acetylhomoserine aminocarboxypropyltransferase [Nonlabens tegetincola]MEE2801980.1 O-acetylhomoserine aminocarboxypropyltransferase/cysteine synthase family protein [Bacteroidota bacterium]